MFVCIISYFLMDDSSDLDKCRVLPWWLCNLFIYNLSSAQRTQQEPCKHCPSILSSLKAETMKVPSNTYTAAPAPLSNLKCEQNTQQLHFIYLISTSDNYTQREAEK